MSSCVRVEIWNMAVASTVLLLVGSALSPAISLLNSALEDSGISAKVGYLTSTLFLAVTIPASLCVPLLRKFLGHKTLIVCCAALHCALYGGMIFLNETAVYVGVVVTGLAAGVIAVVIQDYVTSISRIENIERNLSCLIFVSGFSGIVGSIINFSCLDSSGKLDNETRIRIYGTCVGVTVLAVLLGLFLLRPITAATQGVESISASSRLLDSIRSMEQTDRRSFKVRFLCFMREPAFLNIVITNAVAGVISIYTLTLVTAVRNTFNNLTLIPIMGFVSGVLTVLANATFYPLTRKFSYQTLVHSFTWLHFLWLFLLVACFPGDSFQTPDITHPPILHTGDWIAFIMAIVTGISVSYNLVLTIVTAGRVAGYPQITHGLKPHVLFAVQSAVYGSANALFNLLTPYVSMYVLVLITFVGLLAQYYCYLNHLLRYMIG